MSHQQTDDYLLAELGQWVETLHESTAEKSGLVETYTSQLLSTIPAHISASVYDKMDAWLRYFQTFIQECNLQTSVEESLINQAKRFNRPITSLEDVKQLSVTQQKELSNKIIARHRMYASMQGSVVGSGNKLAMFTDVLTSLVIHLRSIQLTAMSYGFTYASETEKIIALKVYCAAILPQSLKAQAWEELLEETDASNQSSSQSVHFLNEHHTAHFLKSLGKLLLVHMYARKKKTFPMISAIFSAGYHYTYAKRVTEFADRYYQFRSLKDKEQQS